MRPSSLRTDLLALTRASVRSLGIDTRMRLKRSKRSDVVLVLVPVPAGAVKLNRKNAGALHLDDVTRRIVATETR